MDAVLYSGVQYQEYTVLLLDMLLIQSRYGIERNAETTNSPNNSSSPAPEAQIIATETRYPNPMNATVTQSDPKTVNYEDVFRTARRKCLLWPLVPRCCFLLWMSSVSCKDTYLPMHTFSSKTKKNLYNLSLYHNKYSSLHYDDNLLLPKI